MGIAPVTGIPLPFVSVGGSSLDHEPARDRRAAGDPRSRATTVRPKLPLAPLAVVKLLRELRSSTVGSAAARARRRAFARRRAAPRARAGRRRERGARLGVDATTTRPHWCTCSPASRPTRTSARFVRQTLQACPARGRPRADRACPYALATDILPLRPGEGFPARGARPTARRRRTRTPPSRSPRGCPRSAAASLTRSSRASRARTP